MSLKLCILLIFLIPGLLFADTIELKSGAKVEGKLIRLSETSATLLKADSTTVEYALAHVQVITDASGAVLYRTKSVKVYGHAEQSPNVVQHGLHRSLFQNPLPTSAFLALGYGKLMDNDGVYRLASGHVRRANLFLRRQYRSRFDMEVLTEYGMFSLEWNRWNVSLDDNFDLYYQRFLVMSGFNLPEKGLLDFAYQRFGLLFDASGDQTKISPVWGVVGGRKIGDNWFVRGKWYTNPLAFILTWTQVAQIHGWLPPKAYPLAAGAALENAEDDDFMNLAYYHRPAFYRYISGFQASWGYCLNDQALIEAGIASDEIAEVFLRLTWTNFPVNSR